MLSSLKRLLPGFLLVAIASGVLLATDLHNRRQTARKMPRVAILQFASRPVLDDSVDGILQSLAENGLVAGRSIEIRRFNAQNDLPTADNMARHIVDGNFDMAITVSTPCAQAMATANRQGKVVHVFGTVTDPFAAGLAAGRKDPLDHPEHLAGIGTFQPVKEVFRMAKEAYPGLASVGVVWCPSETCSEACVFLAREVCEELDIKLVEASIDNSSAVLEAARSLVGRGVDALWVGGDNIVETSMSSVVKAAREGRIPVFANAPIHAESGALISLGADYVEVGRETGDLAARILKGLNPAEVPIENVVPQSLALNLDALTNLKDRWAIPEAMMAAAAIKVSAGNASDVSRPLRSGASAGTDRKYRIGIVYYGPDASTERAIEGFLDGLLERGYERGRNLEVHLMHAQGDPANLPLILQNFDGMKLDFIAAMTTPCLTAAIATVKRTPIVFASVNDPIAAGAGKSFTDHLPNVTGAGSFPPLEDSFRVVRRVFPSAKVIGTVYNSGEANSVRVMEAARDLAQTMGMRFEEITIGNSSETYEACRAVAGKGIDVFWLPGDNTVMQAFGAAVKVMTDARIPMVIPDVEFVSDGALIGVGVSFYKNGEGAAEHAARMLAGESPASIPIVNVSVKQLVLNLEVAEKLGVRFPEDVLIEAGLLDETPAVTGRSKRIRIVQLMESSAIQSSREGFLAGLREAGLLEGRDFDVRVLDAQGDVAILGSVVDAALREEADMICTVTTPALQTAIRRVKDRPIVFTLSLDPLLVGDNGSHEDHLPNVAGVFDRSPFEAMMSLIHECLPGTRKIGTLYSPSEVNAVHFKDELIRVAKQSGLEAVAVASSTPSEASMSVLALLQKGVEVVCQINDNLHDSCFAAISGAAERSRVPVFTFSTGLVREGAVLALANDHFDAGRESGAIAARILRGESPGSIPYRPSSLVRLAVNLEAARKIGVELPKSVLNRAEEVIGKEKDNHQ